MAGAPLQDPTPPLNIGGNTGHYVLQSLTSGSISAAVFKANEQISATVQQGTSFTAPVSGTTFSGNATVALKDATSSTTLQGPFSNSVAYIVPADTTHTLQFDVVGKKDGDKITWKCEGAPISPLTVTSIPSLVTRENTPYSQSNTAHGGVGPYTYSVGSGQIPPGTTLNTSTGLVSGNPSPQGSFSYTIHAHDSQSPQATADGAPISGNIDVPGVTVASTPSGATQVGVAYSQTNVASGGNPAYIYSLSSGAVPAGTTLNASTGLVSGTPTVPGPFSYTVRATDTTSPTHLFGDGGVQSGTIGTGTLVLSCIASVSKQVGLLYQQVSAANGGTPDYTYSVSAGTLPAGTSLDPVTGVVTGGPTAAGPINYTIKATDSAGAFTTCTVTGTILSPALVLTSTNALTMVVGLTYSQGNVASGGTPAYTYSIVGGAVPAGTSLNTTTGTVSGTPTTPGPFTYDVRVVDTSSPQKSDTKTITGTIATVASTALVLNSTPSANQKVGVLYSQTNIGAGGTPPYTYALTGGAIPVGTSFNVTTGTVSGTPTVAGPYSYVVQVTDSSVPPKTASNTVTGSIALGNPTSVTLVSSLNPSVFGQPVTFTATVNVPAGTPTGSVTFRDGNTVLATVPLVGNTAQYTTSTLATGPHSITATYNGDANFNPATSAVLIQVVNIPPDSLKLRALQIAATKLEAQASAQAITSAVDNAIADGFAGVAPPVIVTATGARFNFFADDNRQRNETQQRFDWLFGDARATGGSSGSAGPLAYDAPAAPSRFDSAFGAVGAGPGAKVAQPTYRDWMLWGDVTWTAAGAAPGIAFATADNSPELAGRQFNFLLGLTRRVSPVFLVGAVGGYETFNYTSQVLSGKLTGQGWTGGSYFGWKFWPGLRLDGELTYSALAYDGTAGTASGSFWGRRILASTSLTGTYHLGGVELSPIASVYSLWEREDAYTDSLGILQADRSFSTGRASLGGKIATNWVTPYGLTLSPYLGAFADYHWSVDSADGVDNPSLLASAPLLDGVSARLAAGWAARMPGGASLTLGGELGGIGSQNGTEIWTLRALGSLPF